MEKEELVKAFAPHAVPPILLELLELFESDEGWLCCGFEFEADEEGAMLGTYSQDPAFVNRFIIFAQADSTGSSYALWLVDEETSPENAPVVIFGGEGGVHAVANDLKQWLQLLSIDVEPMVDWDRVDYYKDAEEDELSGFGPSDRIGQFHEWLKSRHGISPTQEGKSILEAANELHQEALTALLEKHQA